MTQILILVRGLPGSGKSTLAKQLAKHNSYAHFEADMYHIVDGTYQFNPKCVPLSHQWCKNQTKIALQEGFSVIVSNTFTQKWEMWDYTSMASDLNVDTQIIECHGTFTNIHNVPTHAIERMRNRWENI